MNDDPVGWTLLRGGSRLILSPSLLRGCLSFFSFFSFFFFCVEGNNSWRRKERPKVSYRNSVKRNL